MAIIKDYLYSILNKELVSTKNSDNLLIDIINRHKEKHRYYHSLLHLETMLNYFAQYESHIHDKNAMILSILFHDIIYDVKAKDNEIKSAEYAKNTLSRLGLNPILIQNCEAFILASASHQKNSNTDINYFLDFDLNILGQPWETYLQYTQQIRKEYSIYPDTLYIPGRINILEHFLTFDSIYKTKPFLEHFENKAQKNIKLELVLLKNKNLSL